MSFLSVAMSSKPIDNLLEQLAVTRRERLPFVHAAGEATNRLCAVMAQKTDQSHRLRALLYSMWNGKPTSLLEIVVLDWPLRRDLGLILMAFGYEDRETHFFYDELK